MARHYVSINRGVEGEAYIDFHVNTTEPAGTAPAGIDLFVFSVLDGVTPTRKEVDLALEAFERFFENAQQVGSAGFDVTG
jgi:hypothetical protein